MKQPKIVIIGAGASGLAAAARLYNRGFQNLTILEAENRIGGRIHSVDFGGSIVDLGAQWCHGENDNIVYHMVKDLKLLNRAYNDYTDFTYYGSNGTVLDKNVTDTLFDISAKIYNDLEATKQYQGSYGDYFMETYKKRVNEIYGHDSKALETSSRMIDWFHKLVLCYEAAPSWHELPSTSKYKSCEGYQQWHWQNKGFKIFLNVMLGKFLGFSKVFPIDELILYNKEVCKIIWSNKTLKSSSVIVKCSDGSKYIADNIIITVSIGVLQNNFDMFEPSLPHYKIGAIENIKLGVVNKILLLFPTKWWSEEDKGFSLIWTEEDRKSLSQEFPYGPKSDNHSWLEGIFGFYVVDSHPRVLLGWVVGSMAGEVEKVSDKILLEGCMFLLRKFLGKLYTIPEPEKILRSNWQSNPHFLGSYSYKPFKARHDYKSYIDLLAPLPSALNPKLLFAGEATHDIHFSTVHGAVESGYREASRLIYFYKRKAALENKL